MIPKIRKLFEELNSSGVRYCHWKSNYALCEALSGRSDLDLLIHRKDAYSFRILLAELDFRLAVNINKKPFPSVQHYYALDEESGFLVHLHIFYRVTTGESLSKNYRLPLETMLLQNTREINSIKVPTKGAELVIFILRMMLKHTYLVELLLLIRSWSNVQDEARWLMEDNTIDDALDLVNQWLPPIDTIQFSSCVASLRSPASLLQRIILGHRMRSSLRTYARYTIFRTWLIGIREFGVLLVRRLRRSKGELSPINGGAVIAFVGPEATGKSSLLSELTHWLGEHFSVQSIHVGKPPSTALSFIPNFFVPMLRRLLPNSRSSRVEAKYYSDNKSEETRNKYPVVFAIRSILLAYDRRSLLSWSFSQSANGSIVLCDRYPSLLERSVDSGQMSHLPTPTGRFSIRRLLAHIERRMYQEIPPSDLVLHLNVPVEIAVLRNAAREKKEPEEYIRFRHAQSTVLDFGHSKIIKIDTNKPFAETVLEVKKVIWHFL